MQPPSPPREARGAAVDTAGPLDCARIAFWEQPEDALRAAVRCAEQARVAGDDGLRSRALSLQGVVSLHRGDLRGAFALAADAERYAGEDVVARAELHALSAHLHFFAGGYAEALSHAERGIDWADRAEDIALRVHARRMACVAFGNLGTPDLADRIAELLELAMRSGHPFDEALARNDAAHFALMQEDREGAETQLADALRAAGELAPHNRFVLGVLHCTRGELRLSQDRPVDALADAGTAIGHLTWSGDINPYLLGMTVLLKVRALIALDRVEDARRAGEEVVEQLGDSVPQARSMVLFEVAEKLRANGRPEEAYDALSRGARLEREAMQEMSSLQLGLERARLEMAAARHEADALTTKNRELEALVAQLAEARAALEHRTGQLLDLHDQLRHQAEHDFLTGVSNRRGLARATAKAQGGPLSLAILDLDHFKSVNDRFGHPAGDRVLVGVAELLERHLRTEDTVVRTGGEEFALLMPGAGAVSALAACERLRAVIAEARWDGIADGLTVTASIGLVTAPDPADMEELERIADKRLYVAKRAGRNRVQAV